jgi:hypothetical protein
MAESNEQYKYLFGEADKKVRIGILLRDVKRGTGGNDGDSGNLGLEATLVGENEDTLLLENVNTVGATRRESISNGLINYNYGTTFTIKSGKAAINKDSIALVYLIEEKKDG